MKTIEVSAAVIYQDGALLATQRGYGDQKGGWEFPGGKLEVGETPEKALVREIREELELGISILEELGIVEYDYPAFHLRMHCFRCEIIEGCPVLKEHSDARWLTSDTLHDVDWLPADAAILDQAAAYLPSNGQNVILYHKLVRDRIPEIIAQAGKKCSVVVLSDSDYLHFVDSKLDEELNEYHKDQNIEELADLLEVIYAAAEARGSSRKELEDIRKAKAEMHGGFRKKLLLERVYSDQPSSTP